MPERPDDPYPLVASEITQALRDAQSLHQRSPPCPCSCPCISLSHPTPPPLHSFRWLSLVGAAKNSAAAGELERTSQELRNRVNNIEFDLQDLEEVS